MEVSSNGFRPAIKHSQGIQDFVSPGTLAASNPKKSKQLASTFVNMVACWARFIELYGPHASVIRRYALTNEPWSSACSTSFKHLQREVASRRIIKPFSPVRKTRIRADFGETHRPPVDPARSTPTGTSCNQHSISGVLLQAYTSQGSTTWFPVAFASRLLTQLEEKSIMGPERAVSTRGEALACAFCCERWYSYLRILPHFELNPDSANLAHAQTSTAEFMLQFNGFLLVRFARHQVSIVADLRNNNTVADGIGRGATTTVPEGDSILMTVKSSLGGLKKKKGASIPPPLPLDPARPVEIN